MAYDHGKERIKRADESSARRQKEIDEKGYVESDRIYQIASGGGDPAEDRKSSSGCFSPNTKIETPSGKKNIAELKVGDHVLSVNKKGVQSYNRILRVASFKNRSLVNVLFTNGTDLKVTLSHSLLVKMA